LIAPQSIREGERKKFNSDINSARSETNSISSRSYKDAASEASQSTTLSYNLGHNDPFDDNAAVNEVEFVTKTSDLRSLMNIEYELTTMYEEGVDSYEMAYGTVFDVTTIDKELIVTSIDIDTDILAEDMKIQIWTREGSFVGHHATPEGWVKVANTTITGMGIGIGTPHLRKCSLL